MASLPVNIADLGVFLVLILSGLVAFMRGFVREVLGIGAWVAAVFATIYGFPLAKPLLHAYISVAWLADAITGITIFLVTLVVCSAISHALSRNIRGSGFGALDRSLGLLFGLLRGAVLVCLAYLVMVWLVPEDERPAAVTQARSLPLVDAGAEQLKSLLPESALQHGTETAGEAKQKVEQTIEAGKLLQSLTAAPGRSAPDKTAKPAAPNEKPGYKDAERKDLDRLFQSAQ